VTAPRSTIRRSRGLVTLLLLASASAGCRPGAAPRVAAAAASPPPLVRPVAQARIPTGTRLGEHEVGGLSALAYDREADLFYALVDDASARPPARVLRLRWRPPAEPELVDWLLLEAGGAPLPGAGADLEGLVRTDDGTLFVSSEGDVDHGLAPWVARFDAGGALQAKLALPSAFVPGPGRGARHNMGFEALTLEPGARGLLAGVENALLQDQAPGSPAPARSRLLRWELPAAHEPRQWVYPVDPPHAPAPEAGAVRVAGLVDLLPMVLPTADGTHLLALERSWVEGVGFAIELYEAWLDGAEEVTGVATLGDRGRVTARKRLLADLGELGVPLDNYEGMTWGPPGASGAPLLVLVADNNFNVTEQTWLLAFEVTPRGRATPASRSWLRRRR
jgi:hypothetical protein